MTKAFQPAAIASRSSHAPRSVRNLQLIRLRRPTKDGETRYIFFIPSLFCDLSLFNLLIINSLNKQKT
jgi:hypothetical protein